MMDGRSTETEVRLGTTERALAAVPHDPARPTWLARRKVMIPERPEGALSRPSLVERCDPTRQRLTLLLAPGGFGKTVLLAECCRQARADGVTVGWVSLDEYDDPETLVSYLAFALAESGAEFEFEPPDATPDSARYRIDALLHWIGTVEGNVVIALDDVDRLEPESVALVDYLVWRGPANLRLALAFRTRPRGLDIATPVVEGRGTVISTDDLRFQRQEIARYFDTALPRERLRSLWEESAGWPLAVCVQRNVGAQVGGSRIADEISSTWVETRLLRGISASDREFTLEVGLFEWADEDLLERVLHRGALRRLRSLTPLVGLVQEVADGSFSLHPVLRRYAADALWERDRERFCAVHRRIALVLSERGQTIEAMQHARQADEPRLAGRILERAGGIRVGFREGMHHLEQAARLLTPDVVNASARLGLVDCGVLANRGDLDQARRRFAALGAQIDDESASQELRIDLALSRGMFLIYGFASIGPQVDAVIAELADFASEPAADPTVKVMSLYGRALLSYEIADFDNARHYVHEFRSAVSGTANFVAVRADLLLAAIAFAQGEPATVEAMCARGAQVAKRYYAYDTSPIAVADAILAELDLERNRMGSLHQRAPSVDGPGAWLDVHVAATDAVAVLAARTDEERALTVVARALEKARQRARPRLVRCLAALQVSNLVHFGRWEEAASYWESASLPTEVSECADLSRQSWREMECVCSARGRLLAASGQLEEASALSQAFATAARGAGLVRSLTYANAVAIYAAWRKGDVGGARAQTVENLELFDQTGYCRALLWHPESTMAALHGLGEDIETHLDAARNALLPMVSTQSADPDMPDFSARELEILARLGHARDKEIARELDLTDNGVRYHVKNIFRKLGVSNRRAAANRARSLGVVRAPDPE